MVNISEHRTRVIEGGSLMNRQSKVVGLLFGAVDEGVMSIYDSTEVEFTQPSNSRIILDNAHLESKVFLCTFKYADPLLDMSYFVEQIPQCILGNDWLAGTLLELLQIR